MMARYYNSSLARFLTADPASLIELQQGNEDEQDEFEEKLRYPQLWNAYSYVLNNPLLYVDPDGEEATAAVATGTWLAFGGGNGAGAAAATGATVGGTAAAGGGAFVVGYAIGTGVNQIPGVSEFVTNVMASAIALATGTSLMADNTGKIIRQADSNIKVALAHLALLESGGGPGKDPDFNHHKHEIKTHLKNALKKAEKLVGKAKERIIQKVKSAAGKAGIALKELGLR